VTIVERQSGGLAERPAEQVDRLRTLIEEHGEADTVHFYASTDALAPEEASWVSEVADQLGMQVDVHLHDG
jgi:hypothetical protein